MDKETAASDTCPDVSCSWHKYRPARLLWTFLKIKEQFSVKISLSDLFWKLGLILPCVIISTGGFLEVL